MKKIIYTIVFVVALGTPLFALFLLLHHDPTRTEDVWRVLFKDRAEHLNRLPERPYPTAVLDFGAKTITATLVPSSFDPKGDACHGLLNVFPERYFGVDAADRLLSEKGVTSAGAMRYHLRYRALTPSGLKTLVFVETSYGCLILEEDEADGVSLQLADRVRP